MNKTEPTTMQQCGRESAAGNGVGGRPDARFRLHTKYDAVESSGPDEYE